MLANETYCNFELILAESLYRTLGWPVGIALLIFTIGLAKKIDDDICPLLKNKVPPEVLRY